MSTVQTKRIRTATCWLALLCLVFPMFGSYFFDDIFSSLSQLFSAPEQLELGWNQKDYGFYASGYSVLCVFGGLIICGILLDIYGVRIVGSIFVSMMILGAALIWFALQHGFSPSVSVKIAFAGKMLFGLGSEIAGVAVTRSIAKWFKGRNMALAMGLHLAIARLGTAAALIISPMLLATKLSGEMYSLTETARPALTGLMLLLAGGILWAIFVAMDLRFDRTMQISTDRGEIKEEDKFRFSDIIKVLRNPRFIMIALLCVFFYCCIISFKKFGTAILIPRFEMDVDSAKWMLSLIPFFTVVFTPLFGAFVDKVGKATRWMLVGAGLVFLSHLIILLAPQGEPIYGYLAISLLGIGYSLVPSAMWPSVPKIIPEKNLGTAYSLLYWIQNIGLMLIPILVGNILDKAATAMIGAKNAEYIFVILGIISIIVSVLLIRSSRKHPELHLDEPVK